MKLELKILWFDDQPASIESYQERIQRHLGHKGFYAKFRNVQRVKDIKSLLQSLISEGDPNLILLDWNMGYGQEGAITGATIAKELRRKFKYQDIVFYSAAQPGQLRKAVFKQNIDGVYCVNRFNLVAETCNIIDTMLSKVLDIDQMRGMVVSNVSRIDLMVSDCLYKIFACADTELQKAILQKFFDATSKYHAGQLEKIGANFIDNSLIDYEKLSVLNTRYTILKKILKENEPDDGSMEGILQTLTDFEKDILIHRNALAHAAEISKKGTVFLEHNGTIYDQTQMTDLRMNLQKHLGNFQCIEESIESGVFTPYPL